MNIKKIAIIWISGTGKTTLARKIWKILHIPIIHYDEFVRWENRTEIHEKIVENKLKQAMKKEKWIIEWYIHPAAEMRLENADMIIYLDYSGWGAILGWLKRRWQHRGKTRLEMADGCIEKFDRKYLKVMFTREERPEIEDAIKDFEDKIIRLKTKSETINFIKKLENRQS
jgi:adenylate kinase family enzyme